jgi:hypothetical protein
MLWSERSEASLCPATGSEGPGRVLHKKWVDNNLDSRGSFLVDITPHYQAAEGS